MKTLYLVLALSLITIQTTHACEIKVLGNADKYPKVYLEDGNAKGILVDMMKFIGQEIDCHFIFQLSPWKRAYVDMLHGHGMIIGLSKTTERLNKVNYSDVMYTDELKLVTLQKNQFAFTTLDDLAGKSVAFSRGATYGDNFDKAIQSGLFTAFPDNGSIESRLMLILYERVDVGIFGPGESAIIKAIENENYLKQNQDRLYIVETPLKQDPNYLGFAKGAFSQQILMRINEAIHKGRTSGAFATIESNYLE